MELESVPLTKDEFDKLPQDEWGTCAICHRTFKNIHLIGFPIAGTPYAACSWCHTNKLAMLDFGVFILSEVVAMLRRELEK